MLSKVSNPTDSMLESLAEKHDRLWVVLAHDNFKQLGWDSRPIIRKIEKRYVNLENLSFEGVNVKLTRLDNIPALTGHAVPSSHNKILISLMILES